jgi:hypothetical protein
LAIDVSSNSIKVARVTVRATTQGLMATCGGVRGGIATLVAKSFPQNWLIEKQPTQKFENNRCP